MDWVKFQNPTKSPVTDSFRALTVSGLASPRREDPSLFNLSAMYCDDTISTRADIVFVDGLGGQSRRARLDGRPGGGGGGGRGRAWGGGKRVKCLEAGLVSLSGHFRVLSFDYDTEFGNMEDFTTCTILHQAEILVDLLADLRSQERGGAAAARPPLQKKTSSRPIIFVGRGLGGFIVKNALVTADRRRRGGDEEDNAGGSSSSSSQDIFESTVGAVFLGTPDRPSPSNLAAQIRLAVQTETKKVVDAIRTRQSLLTLAWSTEPFKPLFSTLEVRRFSEYQAANTNLKDVLFTIDTTRNRATSKTATALSLARAKKSGGVFDLVERRDWPLKTTPLSPIHFKGYFNRPDAKQFPCSMVEEAAVGRLFAHFKQYSDPTMSLIDPEASPLAVWPLVVLHGHQSKARTATVLEYINRGENTYGAVIWLIATNQSSISASFRDIARQIVPHLTGDQLAAFEGIPIDHGNVELSETQLRRVADIITEWLEQPQEKKWLLVVDDLSPSSAYPVPSAVAGLIDHTPTKTQTWPELLRLLPTASTKCGHIIVTTKDPDVPVSLKISLDAGAGLVPPPQDKQQRHGTTTTSSSSWLKDVRGGQRISFGELGNDRPAAELAIRAWKVLARDLAKASKVARGSSSPLLGWMQEHDIAIRCDHTMRNCQSLVAARVLANDGVFWRHNDVPWADLAALCEQHSLPLVAGRLYVFARDSSRFHLGTDGWDVDGLQLRLGCAMADLLVTDNKRENKEDRVEDDLAGILGQTRGAISRCTEWRTDSSDERQLLLVHLAARRQRAAIRASKGLFNDAVDELSKILELDGQLRPPATVTQEEDTTRRGNRTTTSSSNSGSSKKPPNHIRVRFRDAIMDLVCYLGRGEQRSAAAAVLHRLLLEEEREHGASSPDHPATLSLTEALATALSRRPDKLDEAVALYRKAWQGRCKRLGRSHPTSILCRARLAAVLGRQGHFAESEAMHRGCLDGQATAAVSSDRVVGVVVVGRNHPLLVGVRENYAICLASLRDWAASERELTGLVRDLRICADLFPMQALHRVEALLLAVVNRDRVAVDGVKWNTLDL